MNKILITLAMAFLGSTLPAQAFEVKINSGQFSVGGEAPQPQAAQPAPAAANPRAWYCEVKAFMDTFDGYGPTRLEATKAAQTACQGKNHEMHCRDAKCQENR